MWETVGLWNYSVPGLYLFAQFCLGILFALSNLVNRSVFIFLSNGDGQSLPDDSAAEGELQVSDPIYACCFFGLVSLFHQLCLSQQSLFALKASENPNV